MAKQTKAEIITAAIIQDFKGLPGEFYMLKGLLCAERDSVMPYGSASSRKYRSLISTKLIAARMDQINQEAVEIVRREQQKKAG